MAMGPISHLWGHVACVLHAVMISSTWYLMFVLDRDVVTTRVWVALACTWPLWTVAFALPGRSRRIGWALTLAVGLVILFPTFSTLYSFAVWQIEGFAP